MERNDPAAGKSEEIKTESQTAPPSPGRARHWSAQDVGQWLASLGLSQYKENFEKLAIDGSCLFDVTEADLVNDLGVSVRIHRSKILKGVAVLQHPEVPVPAPAAAPVLEVPVVPADKPLFEDAIAIRALEGPLANKCFVVGTTGASVGRHSQSNDIVIPEQYVSRRHFEIVRQNNNFVIIDVGTTTGTFLMVTDPVRLQAGSMFQMGMTEVRVDAITMSPTPLASLTVVEGPGRGQSFSVTSQGVTLGRDARNGFFIREDSQMSSFHAKITYDTSNNRDVIGPSVVSYQTNNLEDDDRTVSASGPIAVSSMASFLLWDVGSTNRTWQRLSAEGCQSGPVPLRWGDIIKIGSSLFLVQKPDEEQLQALHARPNHLRAISVGAAGPAVLPPSSSPHPSPVAAAAGNHPAHQTFTVAANRLPGTRTPPPLSVAAQPPASQPVPTFNATNNLSNFNQYANIPDMENVDDARLVPARTGSQPGSAMGSSVVGSGMPPMQSVPRPAVGGDDYASRLLHARKNVKEDPSRPPEVMNNVRRREMEEQLRSRRKILEREVANLQMQFNSLKAQNKFIESTGPSEEKPAEETTVCKVCFERPMDVVLYPCGHIVVCEACGALLRNCPICRQAVREVVKVFRA
eukprot:GILJ01005946.1.p1 GENE.GILJ01005946.1~~GILJ01005946.1.p1  ORF type:complete len:633 (+),score=87.92 GILJ01005946.1:94-1992(+)